MKLRFIGTRGEVKGRTGRHYMHSSLLVEYLGVRLMLDCGNDWLGRLSAIRPHAIVITHAHPDHAWGLKEGAPCPVFASAATWSIIGSYPLTDRRTIVPRRPAAFRGFRLEAFPVEHSIRAPAVGYRITAGAAAVFYAPDLVYIHDRRAALAGVKVYIGDGATMTMSMVRRRGDGLFGHTPVRTQLTWCQKEGVPRALITHCGSQIVAGDEQQLAAQLSGMAAERGVDAMIAYDGMELILR